MTEGGKHIIVVIFDINDNCNNKYKISKQVSIYSGFSRFITKK